MLFTIFHEMFYKPQNNFSRISVLNVPKLFTLLLKYLIISLISMKACFKFISGYIVENKKIARIKF